MQNNLRQIVRYVIGLVSVSVWFLSGIPSVAAQDALYLSTVPPVQAARGEFKHESEHRATPARKYWLSEVEPAQNINAYVLHPLQVSRELPIERSKEGAYVSLNLPMQDGPMHGVHNTYVVEKSLADRELLLRIAKWITIHHSCGWGHDYKYDAARIEPKALPSIPLELVCNSLWDGNFHSRTNSGDVVNVLALLYGKPVEGVRVKLVTGKGWMKEQVTGKDGTVSFQLIRDYYPGSWNEFARDHRERFTLVAEYQGEEKGEYSGATYDRTRMISTMSWNYSQSRKDYSSYSSGLFIGALTLAFAGAGAYAYRERRRRPFKEVRLSEED